MIRIIKPKWEGKVHSVNDYYSCHYITDIVDEEVEELEVNQALGDYRDDVDHTARISYREVKTPSTVLKTTYHRHLDGEIYIPLTRASGGLFMPLGQWSVKWPTSPADNESSYIYYCRKLSLYGPNGIVPVYVPMAIRLYYNSYYHKRIPGLDPGNGYGYYYDPRFPGTHWTRTARLTFNGKSFDSFWGSKDPSYVEIRRLDTLAKDTGDVSYAEQAAEILFGVIDGYSRSSSSSYSEYTVQTSWIDPRTFINDLHLSDLKEHKLPYLDSNYLAQKAYQDLGYIDNNAISYIFDTLNLKETVKQFSQTFKSIFVTQGRRRAKAFASSYLSEHYGLRLQLLDTLDYIRNVAKYSSQSYDRRCAGQLNVSENGWKGIQRYQCYYSWSPENMNDKVNELLSFLDLAPTLENIWDVIPFSFVIDWFISLGDELTALDNATNLTTKYDVHGWTLTTYLRRTVEPFVALTGIAYDLSEVYFARSVGKSPIIPLPPIDTESTSSLSSHICEGAALLVTKV